MQNYDDDMVRELGPKIEALYKKFKTLDRVVFQLTTNNPLVPGDFFKNVIELKRFD